MLHAGQMPLNKLLPRILCDSVVWQYVLCDSVYMVWQCCVTVLYDSVVYGVTVLRDSIVWQCCIWYSSCACDIWFDGNIVAKIVAKSSDNACKSWHIRARGDSDFDFVTIILNKVPVILGFCDSCMIYVVILFVIVTACKVVMAWIVWQGNAFCDRDVHAPLLRSLYHAVIYTVYAHV